MEDITIQQQAQFQLLQKQSEFLHTNTTNGSYDSGMQSMLFRILFLSFFGSLSQYLVQFLPSFGRQYNQFSYLVDWIKDKLGYSRTHRITLRAKEIKYGQNRTSWSFSDATKAILWYCNLHIDAMNIYSICETADDDVGNCIYYDEPETVQNNKVDYVPPRFRVDQQNRIHLKDNIYIQFQFMDEQSENTLDGKQQRVSYKVCQILITSTTRRASYMKAVLKDIHEAYLHNLNTNSLKNQYIWFHQGDGKFKKVKFNTNKSWDSFFMEGKEELRDNVRQMADFSNPHHINKHAGLPDHLCILADGAPGTGKNSLFKVLMRCEFPDRQLVIIPPSSVKSSQEIVDIMDSDYIHGVYCPCNKRVIQFDELEKSFPSLCTLQVSNARKDAKKAFEKQKTQPVTFDQFLADFVEQEEQTRNLERQVWQNWLDGVYEKQGMVIFITLNNYKIIDSILKRPGRIHIRVHMKKASNEIARQIVTHVYSYDGKDEKVNALLDQIPDYKFSQSRIILTCCNKMQDFSKIHNNYEWIRESLITLLAAEEEDK